MTCEHKNFHAHVNVINMADTGARMAEIKITCGDCRMPMEFIGLPVGVDFYKPTTDLAGVCLSAPIVPCGEKQKEGLPGFAVKMVS